jgi:hypothetical protein
MAEVTRVADGRGGWIESESHGSFAETRREFVGAEAQEEINAIAEDLLERDPGGLRGTVERFAAEAHRIYPQYAGYWDGWTLARIRTRVVTKMGVAFEAGDVVLAKPNPFVGWAFPIGEEAAAYSVRNGINTAIREGQLDRIEAA